MENPSDNGRKQYSLRPRTAEFMVGQKVWKQLNVPVYVLSKFGPRYDGPFTIRKRINPWNYELVDEDGISWGFYKARELKEYIDENCT